MEDYILQNVAIFFKFVVRHLQNVIDFDNTNANGTILPRIQQNKLTFHTTVPGKIEEIFSKKWTIKKSIS